MNRENAQNAKKSDRRVVRTREVIHKAFFELAAEQPIDKISVSAVADRANVNRKTFYLHYASIDDLETELVEDDVTHLCDSLEGQCVNGQGEIDVRRLFEQLDTLLEEGLTVKSSLYKHTDTDWILNRIEPALVSLIIERDSLNLADKLGNYLDFVVSFFCAGLITSYKKWVNHTEDVDVAQLTKVLSMTVTGGVAGLSVSEGAASLR